MLKYVILLFVTNQGDIVNPLLIGCIASYCSVTGGVLDELPQPLTLGNDWTATLGTIREFPFSVALNSLQV